MKIMLSSIALSAILMAPVLAGAADPINGNSGTPSANPAAAPTTPGDSAYSPTGPTGTTGTTGITGSAGVAQPLPADWKKVKGTVQSADPAMNQVKIKDDIGVLSLVNVNSNVVIRKNGKKVQISDLQVGDRITLTRKITPAIDQRKG